MPAINKNRVLAINLEKPEAEDIVAGLHKVGISAVVVPNAFAGADFAVALSERAPQEVRYMALMFTTGWLCSSKPLEKLSDYLPEA